MREVTRVVVERTTAYQRKWGGRSCLRIDEGDIDSP